MSIDEPREPADVCAKLADRGEFGWRALADASEALYAAADEIAHHHSVSQPESDTDTH